MPDALIIGGHEVRHEFTAQLPDAASRAVIAPLRKEVHYFDLNYHRGEAWYRANFGRTGQPGLNLDSSPYYLFHPTVPQRAGSCCRRPD